jgi:hypothetical protein
VRRKVCSFSRLPPASGVYRGLGGLRICVYLPANTSGNGTLCGLLHSDNIGLFPRAYRASLYLPRALGVDPNGCSYGFGSAWNFAMAYRGTASGSSFVFAAVVAVAIAAIAAAIAAIAAVIAVLLFHRSRWLLCASLAVWLYLDFMSLLKSSCKRLNPRPNPRT